MYKIQAACGCNTGKVRKNNEDNFCFAGKYLSENNTGLENSIVYENELKNGFCAAVFDGMGGENFGETASYIAAKKMQTIQEDHSNIEIDTQAYLDRLAKKLDDAVVDVQQQMFTNRMGTTMVCLLYSDKYMYICNVGDSRAYRFRNEKLDQLSYDHTAKRPGSNTQKVAVNQYLGLGADDIEIEPFIDKSEIENNDIYLLCSDGLSDMLTDTEIQDILKQNKDAADCVEKLIELAIEHGGRDNITIIMCAVTEVENGDK